VDLDVIAGSGPNGAVIARDLEGLLESVTRNRDDVFEVGAVWRVMADRTTRAWQEVPHFFLSRDVEASRLGSWRGAARRRPGGEKIMDQSALIQFLPLVLIFIVFYFLLIRPQQKKQKDHRTMLDALRRGDRIVTGGGILGTVNKVVGPEEVEVDIATGVRVRVLRGTITSVLAKPDPAAAREAAREKDREAARDKGKETVRGEADKV